MEKIIYKGTSNFEFFLSVMFRLLCLVAIGYLAWNYEENPILIVVLGIICFFIFLMAGNDEIIIYPTKLIQGDTSIISLFSSFKGGSYKIEDIKSVSLPVIASATASEIGVALLISIIMPKQRYTSNKGNCFNLELKSGKIVQIKTTLDEDKVDEIVKTINSLLTK